jgi:hypothetical protein
MCLPKLMIRRNANKQNQKKPGSMQDVDIGKDDKKNGVTIYNQERLLWVVGVCGC